MEIIAARMGFQIRSQLHQLAQEQLAAPAEGQGLLDFCRVFVGDGTFAIVDAGVH